MPLLEKIIVLKRLIEVENEIVIFILLIPYGVCSNVTYYARYKYLNTKKKMFK